MDDLIAFLRARLDEDEQTARRAGAHEPDWWYDRETFTVSSRSQVIAGRKADGSPLNDVDGEHIARHDPARVLADVAAKRAIVDLHAPHRHGACPTCWRVTERSSLREDFPCPTLRLLALPFADHPAFKETWKL